MKKFGTDTGQAIRQRYTWCAMVARNVTAAVPRVRLLLADKRSLIAETFGFVFLIVIINMLFLGGASNKINIDLFWIPVLLISAQYGAIGGLLSTFVATAAFLATALPPQLANQDFYSYAGTLLAYPSSWLAYTLVIGGIRSLHMLHAAELTRSLEDTHESLFDLTGGLERALAEIGRLECRIAGDTSTVDAVIRDLARLDLSDQKKMTESFIEVIRDGVGASIVSLYLMTPRGMTSLVRMDADDTLSRSEVPNFSGALLEALDSDRGAISRQDSDGDSLLPPGAVCAAPIKAGPGVPPDGVIVVERLAPNHELGDATRRADLLGSALGKIFRLMSMRRVQ